MKQEIVEKICKYFKLTDFEAEEIYDDIFSGIINGVKEDNIAVITNLGEFIIKFNTGESSEKKTVEFLPTLILEEEINQRSFDESRTFEPSEFIDQISMSDVETTPTIETIAPEEKPVSESVPKLFEEISAVEKMHSESIIEDDRSAVEEDIRKKRESILSKIITPSEQQKTSADLPETGATTIFPRIAAPDFMSEKGDIISKEETISSKTESEKENIENLNKSIGDNFEKPQEIISSEDNKPGSFSDFFTEVNEKEKSVSDSFNKTNLPPVESVIPPSAVELHNQITGEENKSFNYQSAVSEPVIKNGNGSGIVTETGNGDAYIDKTEDNSYYIWYKDSEPNTNDTQTMSYEYELLYQATKEAEYKSKLRIYVTTFIMFFSVVLLLLIFSPVIYKYFFTPRETDQNTEQVQEEPGVLNESTAPNTENQATVNSLKDSNQSSTNATTTTDSNSQVNTNSTQQEQLKQDEQKKDQQPVQPNNIAGVTKTGNVWKDEANGVVYLQLENGKFTIQESAWDSDAKASNRLNIVEKKVPGLKGSVVKVDLGSKGIWYRAMFGEFTTLQEAKSKADELKAVKNK
jgi:hypothetical protein